MSNKEDKRHDNKRGRAAEKESLRGKTPGVVHGSSWSTRVPQPHVPDEAVTGGPSKKGSKSKWCKGRVGTEHEYEFLKSVDDNGIKRHWNKSGWICKKCSKRSWGTPKGMEHPDSPANDHYSYYNIVSRLTGGKCYCIECKD